MNTFEGCCKSIHIPGTNCGTSSCGAVVDMFGKKEQYLCFDCSMKHNARDIYIGLCEISNLGHDSRLDEGQLLFRSTQIANQLLCKINSFKVCPTE